MALSAPAGGQVALPGTEGFELRSRHVGDQYAIQVCLPEDASSEEARHPTVYVLDADRTFAMACQMARWLTWAGELPPVVVVGISYGSTSSEWWQKRSRDYTPTPDRTKVWGEWPLAGGAGAFVRLLTRELFPEVERRYDVDPGERVLVGLSFGGLFGAWTMFTRPDLFSGYVLLSPALAWDDRLVLDLERQYAARRKELPVSVFTAVGSEDEDVILDPWLEWIRIVEEREYTGSRWVHHVFPGETHISVLAPGIARGLKVVLAGN